jgi:hypothetical protein
MDEAETAMAAAIWTGGSLGNRTLQFGKHSIAEHFSVPVSAIS